MEESVQQVIMQSIQELERSSMGSSMTSIVPSSGPEADHQLQRILGELEAAAEARDQMAQRCHELDMQVCTRARSVDLLLSRNVGCCLVASYLKLYGTRLLFAFVTFANVKWSVPGKCVHF
jgi:hypothetical protein